MVDSIITNIGIISWGYSSVVEHQEVSGSNPNAPLFLLISSAEPGINKVVCLSVDIKIENEELISIKKDKKIVRVV